MTKNKKKWINKKKCETFRLVPRSQKFPSDVNDGLKDVHLSTSVGSKDMEEHIKCGIYFDDDYNYLQHLRTVNEVMEPEKVERTVIQTQSNKTVLPSAIFEVEGIEMNAELLDKTGLNASIDADVFAALEGDFDFDDPVAELEDDFVLLANDGEIPSTKPSKSMYIAHDLNNFRQNAQSEDEDEEDSGEALSNLDDDDLNDYGNFNDEDTADEVRGLECDNEPRLIDKQFNQLCEEYNLDSDEDSHEGALGVDPNSERIRNLAREYKNKKPELVLESDEYTRRYVNEKCSESSNEDMQLISLESTRKERAKWDCESILSMHSNIYNRPTVITDSNNRKRKLAPLLKQIDKMDESVSVCSKKSITSVRTRGESTAERKMRKTIVKQFRAERRAEKKCNKLAFKEERKQMSATRRKPIINTKPIF